MRLIALATAPFTLAFAANAGPAPREGWKVHETTYGYQELIDRVKAATKENGMGVVTEAGPTEAAKSRGVDIPGNRVIGVFNNVFAVKMLNASVAAMIEAAEVDDELELASIDRDFHQRLFGEARLTALEPILRRCLVHNHRYKISRSAGPRDLLQTARRHEPIVGAIRAGDAAAAKTALFHHIATIVDFGPTVFPGEPE